MMETTQLNIAAICSKTKVLGPGNRLAFWVQGCPFNCKNCISPEWIPFEDANWVETNQLYEYISRQQDIEGITISGGEPFAQAKPLANLLARLNETRPELNVITFTGYNKKALDKEEHQLFLKHIDVLITGVYIEKYNDSKGLRGSSNQEFHFLTDKLSGHKEYFYDRVRNLEFHKQEQDILMVGIPPQKITF